MHAEKGEDLLGMHFLAQFLDRIVVIGGSEVTSNLEKLHLQVIGHLRVTIHIVLTSISLSQYQFLFHEQ
jgi:hypothetical protein